MRRTTIGFAAILLLVLVAAVLYWTRGTDDAPVTSTTQFARAGGSRAIPAPAASPADDGNWTMPGKDYASTRFSALITASAGRIRSASAEGAEASPALAMTPGRGAMASGLRAIAST